MQFTGELISINWLPKSIMVLTLVVVSPTLTVNWFYFVKQCHSQKTRVPYNYTLSNQRC